MVAKPFSTRSRGGGWLGAFLRHCARGAGLRATALVLGLIALGMANPAAARAEEKIALVIGNSQYRAVAKLSNPANDSADVAATLRRLGFSVKYLVDLDYDGFRRALIEFGDAAKTADKAMIFYAGHGVEIDGKNWLIPVDAAIKSEVDVYAEGINLETLIDISVMPKVIGLVVLDACRNNPFVAASPAGGRSLTLPDPASKAAAKDVAKASEPPSGGTATETISRGLAPVEVTDNVLVAFAAAAGTTASDGRGRNSPYSGALLRYVEKPGLEINYLFRDIHDDVVKETGRQEPAVYGTLSSQEIYLREGEARVATARDAEAEAEKLAWSFIRASNDVATLRRFLEQFPSGLHGEQARERVAQLESAENSAWTIVERQHSIAAYRAFLDLYPYGNHVESARQTLASLESSSPSGPQDAEAVGLPKPPASGAALASPLPDAPQQSPESVDKAWDVLRESRDQTVVNGFAGNYPSLRHHRLPAGSDLSLRPVNPTEWMLRTAKDDDVNHCFAGDSSACVTALDKYPDYVQLRFQLCRTARHPDRTAGQPDDCMKDAVEDARARGYLVSAYTRSEEEKIRNQEYRQAVQRVQQNVGNIVSGIVSNVVSNVVSNSVSSAAGAAAAAAAAGAAGAGAAPAAAFLAPGGGPILAGTGKWDVRLGVVKTALPPAGKGGPAVVTTSNTGTLNGATGGALRGSSNAAGSTSKSISTAVTNAAGKAASNAAGRAASNFASRAASNAAGRAASNAASRAASNAASRAASNAASRAAGAAAANAASRITSDIRLKRDIVALGRTRNGLHLYRYRYIGNDTFYVGVMAQEVAKRVPGAVTAGADGYLQVDYRRLGLKFMTFETWSRRHARQASAKGERRASMIRESGNRFSLGT